MKETNWEIKSVEEICFFSKKLLIVFRTAISNQNVLYLKYITCLIMAANNIKIDLFFIVFKNFIYRENNLYMCSYDAQSQFFEIG